jgi:two-component system, NarL family, response regulator DevR
MQSATQAERITVFIVEDHAAVRERLVSMLHGADRFIVVGQAETPKDAIEGILSTIPDSVVLDVHLTGGNGLEVLRKVRAVQPGIEFVVLTNHPNAQYRHAFMSAGALCVLDKSTEFAKLPDAIAAAGTKPCRLQRNAAH